jgi:hypothetical protein
MYKTFKFKSKNAISKLNKYPNWQWPQQKTTLHRSKKNSQKSQ